MPDQTVQPDSPAEPSHISPYLQVQDLAVLRNYIFAPRHPIRGRYAGRHTSRQRGHCVEFNDYREYAPGDEVGDIDWKVFGRSDRLFIKLFEHQTDMTVGLLIDASASMAYDGLDPKRPVKPAQSWMGKLKALGTKVDTRKTSHIIEHPSKYDQACLIAAAIGFLTIRQQDHIAFAFARRGLHREHDARGGFEQLNNMLRAMHRVRVNDNANLADSAKYFTQRLPRRSLLIIFSDLLEKRAPILQALSAFTSRGGEAIVFHILHEDEWQLPDMQEAIFIDSETERRVRLNVPDIRLSYESRIKELCDNWHDDLTARGIDYHHVSTATHYHDALRDYLFTRAARV